MANEDHVKIVTQGVRTWNRWRKENINVKPDLTEIDLKNADLYSANLSEADLSWTDLSNSTLIRSNLSSASLVGTDLTETDLTKVNLADANLFSSILLGTIINETIFKNTNLTGALFGGTLLSNLDLSGIVGLDAIDHDGPSSIDLSTLYKSQGNIPEIFLRGAGVPENFITYMGSITGKAFEFYTCFISYTEADDAFRVGYITTCKGKVCAAGAGAKTRPWVKSCASPSTRWSGRTTN